jgi:cytochrome c biogenesis protein CcdA/thiol-disulfide isomerase/thioredoxin
VALLYGVAFLAGVVTAISPCVLPVLPLVLAGSATGGPRRPYAVVAGLVASFTAFTLTAAALLSALGLPADLLRNIAIGVVLFVGLALLWPPLGALVERPFQALGRRRPGQATDGFLLGASLGLLFTPCAGPVIAAIAALAATERLSVAAVSVTLAYALGAGAVLLGFAVAARRGLQLRALWRRAPRIRQALGGVVAAVAVLMAFGLDVRLAAHVPGYTRALQTLETSDAAAERLDRLVHGGNALAATGGRLHDYGRAPDFTDISGWLNSEPLDLERLHGKVVLVDFWTYSCVNCLRTLPHVKAWDAAYRSQGLVVVGVHTPEFAFERVPANVERAVRSLGVRYPVALDPDYGTWNAWGNRYWPAKYVIDRRGHVRFAHFGEGEYGRTEAVIRTLLAEPGLPEPVSGSLGDATPHGPLTAETYVGYARMEPAYSGSPLRAERPAAYHLPAALPTGGFVFGGEWTVESERAVAGRDARLRLAFHARKVFLVLGTSGGVETVAVSVDGRPLHTVQVREDRLYTLVDLPGPAGDHVLDLALSPGAEAYAFTFG